MRLHIFGRAMLVAIAVFFAATTARAQTTTDTFDQLQTVVKRGAFLTVTGASGGVFQGPLLDLSTTRLTLKVDGQPREFSIDDVRSISQRQHADLRTGAWWGFGIGAGLGLLALPATECRLGADCAGTAGMMALMVGGMGAGIGAGFAAATVSDHVIFAPRSGPKLSFEPIIDRDGRGVRMSFRF